MKKLYHPTNPFLLTSLSITIDNYKLLEMCGHPTHNCLIHDFGHGLHDVIGPLGLQGNTSSLCMLYFSISCNIWLYMLLIVAGPGINLVEVFFFW